MSHHCHARGCDAKTAPKLFMCRRHWAMVPKPLQDAIWANYVPGQERRKNPTMAYLEAAMEARNAVAEAERAPR
jgi:hypothetical protein